MTLFPVSGDDLETFTIVTNPERAFSSSSLGYSGSVNLFARRSGVEKETKNYEAFVAPTFDDNNLDASLTAVKKASLKKKNFSKEVEKYMDLVNDASVSARKQKQLNIFRSEPSSVFGEETLKKNAVRKVLLPHYRPVTTDNHWAYTNYHCLNFFTGSGLPSDSVLLYPNSGSAYAPEDAVTFEFYINPKYTTDSPAGTFRAGTIMHLSSTYAISLVTGSSRDAQGYPDGFRIQLQLSHSADTPPSLAAQGAFPNDLIFLTSDNALRRNHWHHIAIRWGGNQIDNGTGSFFIDGKKDSSFAVPSSSISHDEAGVLCVGNYYQGLSAQDFFFSADPAQREGLIKLDNTSGVEGPPTYSFDHPLNAELHDIRIYGRHRTAAEIVNDMATGPEDLEGLLFYLPPFFTRESPYRTVLNGQGGVLQTPFFAIDGTTDDPFNVALSFGVGGRYLNTENFLRDFATSAYPRQMSLSASLITTSTEVLSANEFLFATGSVAKRNLFILPCDNGKFIPNFDLLASGTMEYRPTPGSAMDKFVNDLGIRDLSLISLNNLVPTSSLFDGLTEESGAIFSSLAGASPENPGVDPGEVLTVFQRTRDNSSNEVVFFDISNIFYGNRINPGSFSLTDSNLTGSGGKVSLTVRDNGYGSLYRADCLSEHAKWNSVGNILYSEGVAIIKSPNIPMFGKDQYQMTFEGESTIHVLKISAEAAAGMFNSSSHPNFQLLSSSYNANENDSEFVYITNVDWLDDNLNVIMKTNLAQPVKKRTGDKISLRAKLDF